jgi:hypothetical protein
MKFLALFIGLFASTADIPGTWEEDAVNTLELLLAHREFSPIHIDEAAYYRIPERAIYESYPVMRLDSNRQEICSGLRRSSRRWHSIHPP